MSIESTARVAREPRSRFTSRNSRAGGKFPMSSLNNGEKSFWINNDVYALPSAQLTTQLCNLVSRSFVFPICTDFAKNSYCNRDTSH